MLVLDAPTRPAQAAVLRIQHHGRATVVRVDHATLTPASQVEIDGWQLGDDGSPIAQVSALLPVDELPDALVGHVELRMAST